MNTFHINGCKIGNYLTPFVIAEIGVNHEGSMDLAFQLIDDASEAGADAVKFQSYKAEKIASVNSPAYWDMAKEKTPTQFELFKKYDGFNKENYEQLAAYCKTKEIIFLSTPFDLEAVDYLTPLVPAFKIASADITNVPLLRKTGKTGKPIILSTGASRLSEIEFAVQVLRSSGTRDIALLHCVLNYPTEKEKAQLGMISTLKRVFPECLIGYSDHVVPENGLPALEAAMLLGASILEKHFTHDKTLPGNDHYHAMDKKDLKVFIDKSKTYRALAGSDRKEISYEKQAITHARRSIVAAKNIDSGEIFSEENLIAKRPGHGISPVHWDEILGKKSTAMIKEDALLSWKDIGGVP